MAIHATVEHHEFGVPTSMGWWVKQGLVGSIIAGLVFAIFEVVAAGIMQGNFFMPLRMIGAIALGSAALEPGYSLATAGLVGVVVHMVLSMIFGVIFGVIADLIPALRRSGAGLVIAATVFGLLLWIVNFYVIAPMAFPWFENANPAVQFIAHTFFFGTALGLYMRSRLEHYPEEH